MSNKLRNEFSSSTKPTVKKARLIEKGFRSPASKLLSLIQIAVAATLLTSLSGCESTSKSASADEVTIATNPEADIQPLPSSTPLKNASVLDARYAQNTLNSLGFKVGQVDGIWGPRSAQAIRQFELKYGLPTANGLLSELNLFMLEKLSNTTRSTFPVSVTPAAKRGFAAQLDRSTPLSTAPQLVLLGKLRQMLAKPNPFSEKLAELAPGTGIYVISEQEGWYEVESEDKQRGFIKAD